MQGSINSSVEDYLRVLIVEDQVIARTALSALLSAKGYSTWVAGSAEAALDSLESGCKPDFALVDLDLPGMNGASFIDWLLRDRPNVTPILISAAGKERVARLLDPSVVYLRKPLDFNALLDILEQQAPQPAHQPA